jgi:hypothetical protein
MSHTNHESAERFDFKADRHTAVFVCSHVAAQSPVLYVSHDSEGDWQFLCGGADHGEGSGEKPLLVCLEHVVSRDPSLNELAALCTSHYAERETPLSAWRITDQSEEFIADTVRDHGWCVQMIPAGDAEDEPAFAYTIGLFKTFGSPEIIIFGMATNTMGEILNGCGDLVKAGRSLPVGPPVPDVLHGFDVRFREVKAPDSYKNFVGYARWFYKGSTFPLVQLVWPDREGRFPGDPRAAEFMAKAQPLLP